VARGAAEAAAARRVGGADPAEVQSGRQSAGKLVKRRKEQEVAVAEQEGAGGAVAVLLLVVVLGVSVGASFVIPRGSRGILIGLLVGLT